MRKEKSKPSALSAQLESIQEQPGEAGTMPRIPSILLKNGAEDVVMKDESAMISSSLVAAEEKKESAVVFM